MKYTLDLDEAASRITETFEVDGKKYVCHHVRTEYGCESEDAAIEYQLEEDYPNEFVNKYCDAFDAVSILNMFELDDI